MSRARTGKPGRPRKPIPPRMRRDPRDPAAAVLVASVLEAAEHVLGAHGHAGLTTNRVAERAGVSIGSLYAYFPNKEAIAAALFERYLAAYVDAFARAVAAPATYGELVERIVAALIEAYRTQPQIHRYLFEMQSSTNMHERVLEAMDGIVATTARMFRQAGMAERRAEHVAFVLVHACSGISIALYQRGVDDPTEQAQPFVEMVRQYLAHLGIDDARP